MLLSIVFSILVCVLNFNVDFVNSIEIDLNTLISRSNGKDVTDEIYFQCYTAHSTKQYISIPYKNSLNDLPNICIKESNKKLIFFFPGWLGRAGEHDIAIDIIVQELLRRKDVIPIVLNYQNLVTGYSFWKIDNVVLRGVAALRAYTDARHNATIIGKNLASVFANMVERSKINLKKVRLIGISLGAQIASITAKNFQLITGKKIPRITGLDPAGPGYKSPKEGISKDDATFVDVIHTNPGFLGNNYISGTADFFPNYPRTYQRGCPNVTDFISNKPEEIGCSHSRSWSFFVESINHHKHFPACNDSKKYLDGTCASSLHQIHMGYHCSTKASGSYFLSTDKAYPYSLGIQGLNDISTIATENTGS